MCLTTENYTARSLGLDLGGEANLILFYRDYERRSLSNIYYVGI